MIYQEFNDLTTSRKPVFLLFFLFSVGSPIHVERVTSPSNEEIKQLHAEYIRELKRLFEENCTKYNVPKDAGLIIQ